MRGYLGEMLIPLTTALACFLATAGIMQAQLESDRPMDSQSNRDVGMQMRRQSGRVTPPNLPVVVQVTPTNKTGEPTPPALLDLSIFDPQVKQASGCCSIPPRNDLLNYPRNGGQCTPGQTCEPIEASTACGRILAGFYNGLCCPDPCYEPTWIIGANAAFFQDGPRPVTQTRIRWDHVYRHGFPDSAEFFWGKIGSRGPRNPPTWVNYGALSVYQEIAAKGASVFSEMPYYSMESNNNPGSAGFGDINVGTKSVILDRELLILTTQLRTFIPVGNFTTGLGTGHISLEPSLLAALKLSHNTYLQAQIADWIPLGGTPGFAGAVIHYHVSVNQTLWQHRTFLSLVGTVELNGYSFRGEFTNDASTLVGLNGSNYMNAGSGLRLQISDKIDFGFSTTFGFGNGSGPERIYRTELRIRK